MMIYGPISSDTDCKGNRIVVLFTGSVAFLPLASVHWLSLSRNTSQNSQIITGLQNSTIRDPYLNSSNSNCTLFQLKASKTSSQNKAFSLLDLFFRYEPSDNSRSISALIHKKVRNLSQKYHFTERVIWLTQPEVCLPPRHEPGRAGPAALVQFTAAPQHNCPVAISGRSQTFSLRVTHYRG